MSITIEIKVVPSSGRLAWGFDKAGQLKCYLKSPAEQGKANKELIKFTAKTLGIPQSSITIMSGELSRNKRINIDMPVTFKELIARLGIEHQTSLW